jgi:signal transduction histidine kinase
MKFRYLLEGFDHEWIEAGTRREAFYTNLPPGNFRFRVTACNADGNCNETGRAIAFTLMPHYYQRVWFLPLCACSLALLGWMVYRYRIRGLREQFALVLAERSRIARELHDTLIQGFSGIALQMQALAVDLPTPELRSKIDGIIHDTGDCLRETRRSVAGLRSVPSGSPSSGLSAALEQAARQITETKDVRLKLRLGSGPRNLSAEVEYNLLRIALEAVSNSVKHSGARTVEVALNCSAEQVRLSIKDDGSGIVREGNGAPRLGHYGLIGMKERAAQIGADLQLASEPGRGTTVSVLLPTGREGSLAKNE